MRKSRQEVQKEAEIDYAFNWFECRDAFKALLDELRMTQEEAGRAVGRNKYHIQHLYKGEFDPKTIAQYAEELCAFALTHEPAADFETIKQVVLTARLSKEKRQEIIDTLQKIAEEKAIERKQALEKPAEYKTNKGISVFGRENDIRVILEMIDQEQFVTIVGPPGIGKTEVAEQVEKKAKQLFSSVKFLSFVDETDTNNAYQQVLKEVLGETRHPALNTRKLLILDNCEQLGGLTRKLLDLIRDHEQLHILTTSRTMMSNHHRLLSSLDVPKYRDKTPESLYNSDSVQLLLASAKADGIELQITPENAEAIFSLCIACAGLPMALIMVGSWIGEYTLETLIEKFNTGKIYENPYLFADTEPEHHRTLKALIARTYDNLLKEEERRLFRRLAIFNKGCTREGATKVCNLGDLTTPIEELLTTLRKHHLIVREKYGIAYKIAYAHKTLHDFARLLMNDKFDKKRKKELQDVSDKYYAYMKELSEWYLDVEDYTVETYRTGNYEDELEYIMDCLQMMEKRALRLFRSHEPSHRYWQRVKEKEYQNQSREEREDELGEGEEFDGVAIKLYFSEREKRRAKIGYDF